MPKVRGPRPASDGRRRAILDAALDAFTRTGFAAATMEDVRAAAGASTGSVYHHFRGKEQLAAALFVEALRDYQTGFVTVLGGGHPKKTVRALVAYHLRWVEQHPAWARWLLDMGRQAELVAVTEAEVRALNDAFAARVMTWMAPHVERGAMRALPPELCFAILVGPAQVFTRMWLGGNARVSMTQAIRALGDAAWASLDGGAA
jgi:AcrR family transcriptional regulator